MEVLAPFGILASLMVLIVLAVLGFFLPWFVYRIHRNVKAIRNSLEAVERNLINPEKRNKCPKCGKELLPGVTFCNDCGISVD